MNGILFNDYDLIAISALAHFNYCIRRCALVHIEQIWSDNLFTAEGNILHERVHSEGQENRPGVKIERGMPLRSLIYGITGKTDLVEYHASGQVIPVEYKRGKPKQDKTYEIQLCAQALCLEEMLKTSIPLGYLYYGRPRRRSEVVFDKALRELTLETITKTRDLIESGITPLPVWRKKRCQDCSLLSYCFPERMSTCEAIDNYIRRNLVRSREEPD